MNLVIFRHGSDWLVLKEITDHNLDGDERTYFIRLAHCYSYDDAKKIVDAMMLSGLA